jgi:hypothetical protein
MRFSYFLAAAGLAGLACSTGGTGPADTSAPLLAITAPLDQAQVSGQVSIDVVATDDIGVDKVRFQVDGTELAVVYTAPYHAIWNTASVTNNTHHTITATAYDVAKNSNTVNIGVTVSRGTQ